MMIVQVPQPTGSGPSMEILSPTHVRGRDKRRKTRHSRTHPHRFLHRPVCALKNEFHAGTDSSLMVPGYLPMALGGTHWQGQQSFKHIVVMYVSLSIISIRINSRCLSLSLLGATPIATRMRKHGYVAKVQRHYSNR